MSELPLTSKEYFSDLIRKTERAALVNPAGTTSYYLITDQQFDIDLARIEKLITQRHFGQVLERLKHITVPDTPFHEYYQASITEKVIRTLSRIATVYAYRKNVDGATSFYKKALADVGAGQASATERVISLADKYFADRKKERADLLDKLIGDIRRNVYEAYCPVRKSVKDSSLLNSTTFRDEIISDGFIELDKLRRWLETGKGENIPGKDPNWIDMPPEHWGLDLAREATVRPGAGVHFGGSAVRSLDTDPIVRRSPDRMRASFAMPLFSSRLNAHTELFALERGVDRGGQKQRIAPLYRYDYLRERALAILDRVGHIEQKMLLLQDSVDNFAEVVHHVQAPLGVFQEELAALEEYIDAALLAIAELANAESELGTMTQQLKQGVDDCDKEWYESLLGPFLGVVVFFGTIGLAGFTGAGIGALIGLAAGPEGVAVGAVTGSIVGAAGAFAPAIVAAKKAMAAIGFWDGKQITCDNVNDAYSDFGNALGQVRMALGSGNDEMQIALARRDVLQAEIASLSSQLVAVYQDDASRYLDANTIQNILGHYEETRRRLLDQATIVAKKMEASYRFEHGAVWRYGNGQGAAFIGDSYDTADGKGYGARELLLRDIESLEYARLIGRNHKTMQLTLDVSLAKHYPATLVGLKVGGKSAFTLHMEDMDRFYPGTYQHRIKEVRSEVLMDDVPSAVRGYLSCFGPSQIRFPDPGNTWRVDEQNILAEPDRDIARLCYKRAWQTGGRETMAFPDLNSPRASDRVVKRQREERNFFENLGMGVTWIVEILPDQNLDMTHLSDMVITFQIEAEYDDNLRKIIERKRFVNRDEVVAFSARRLAQQQGRSFNIANFSFDIDDTLLPYATHRKVISNIGVFIKPTHDDYINGAARISLQLREEAAIHIETDDKGRAATGVARNAGPSGDRLAAAFHGNNPAGRWKLSLDDLPAGVSKDDVEDVYVLLRYGYA